MHKKLVVHHLSETPSVRSTSPPWMEYDVLYWWSFGYPSIVAWADFYYPWSLSSLDGLEWSFFRRSYEGNERVIKASPREGETSKITGVNQVVRFFKINMSLQGLVSKSFGKLPVKLLKWIIFQKLALPKHTPPKKQIWNLKINPLEKEIPVGHLRMFGWFRFGCRNWRGKPHTPRISPMFFHWVDHGAEPKRWRLKKIPVGFDHNEPHKKVKSWIYGGNS